MRHRTGHSIALHHLLVAATALTFLAVPHPAGAQKKGKAKEHFDKGVMLFKNEDFDAALVEFMAAHEAKPHFAVLYNIGITLYKLHRYVEAFDELERYLLEGGTAIKEGRRDEVIQIMQELRSLVGTLEVACEVAGAVLHVDGEKSPSWQVKLEVGEHEIQVSAPGHQTLTRSVALPGDEVVRVEVDLEPIPEPVVEPPATPPVEEKKPRRKLPPAGFWAGLGVTAALGIGLAVTGGLALGNHARYEDMTYEDPDWRSVRDRGLRLNIAADVLIGLTGAAAIATIVLALFTDFGGKEARAALIVSPAGGSLVVGMAWRLP